MNRVVKVLSFVLLISLLASGCAKQAKLPTQIFAFGDDYSDNGTSSRLSKQNIDNKVPNAFVLPTSPLYWEGRWSNGPVAVEVMAERMQVKLTSYAIFGASSDRHNIVTEGSFYTSGLLGQIDTFVADLNGQKADPGALYFIFTSAAIEFWEAPEWTPIEEYITIADRVLDNIKTAVTKLSEQGAKRFMVVNTFNHTDLPFYTQTVVGVDPQLEAYQTRFTSQLPIIMSDTSKQFDVEIMVFDLLAVHNKIRTNPQKYGLTNLTDPCMADYWATTACDKSEEYFYMDPFHWTHTVHQVVGEEMAAVYGK